MKSTTALLLAASLSFVASQPVAAEPAPAKAAAENRVTCFSEKTTGSHLRKRICVTREEQERRRKEDQEALRKLGRTSAAGGASRGRD